MIMPRGWASLRAVIDETRADLHSPGTVLACPFCGEPLIGNVCTFDAVHVQTNQPPAISEEIMSATDPGPWESLLGVLRDAGDNARIEAQTPPVACPRCGEPLVMGHCTFDGFQGERAEE